MYLYYMYLLHLLHVLTTFTTCTYYVYLYYMYLLHLLHVLTTSTTCTYYVYLYYMYLLRVPRLHVLTYVCRQASSPDSVDSVSIEPGESLAWAMFEPHAEPILTLEPVSSSGHVLHKLAERYNIEAVGHEMPVMHLPGAGGASPAQIHANLELQHGKRVLRLNGAPLKRSKSIGREWTLEVWVESAKNLSASDMSIHGRSSDPFVELICGVQKRKSSVIKKSLNPVWDEVGKAPLPDQTALLSLSYR